MGRFLIEIRNAEQLGDGDGFKHVQVQSLKNLVKAMRQIQTLLCNRDQHVGGYRDPNLRLHCGLGRADKRLDAKVLLDPLEEQFDLPALLVQRGNRRCRKAHVVGQEHQLLARQLIGETHPPEQIGIALAGVIARQFDALVACDARSHFESARLDDLRSHIVLGTCHKERLVLLQKVHPLVVDIGFVHYIKAASLDVALLCKQVEHLYVVHFAIRQMHKTGNAAAYIEQCMDLDGRLRLTKGRPRKERQAQIDGAGVERVDGQGTCQKAHAAPRHQGQGQDPGWPLQTPPLLVTQIPPGRNAAIVALNPV